MNTRVEVTTSGRLGLVIKNGIGTNIIDLESMVEMMPPFNCPQSLDGRIQGPLNWICDGGNLTMQLPDGTEHTWVCLV